MSENTLKPPRGTASMRLLAIATACALAAPANASELVGAIVPPYPEGTSSDMGSCIADDHDICAYAIATLNGPDGTVVAILAQEFIEHASIEPVWEVTDMLDAPEPVDGAFWAFEECHVGSEFDASVIGLVTAIDMGGWLETLDTLWAVRLDVASGGLVELDPAEVHCVLPGS